MTIDTQVPVATTASVTVATPTSSVDYRISFGPSTTVGDVIDQLPVSLAGDWGGQLWIDGAAFSRTRILADLPIEDGIVMSSTAPAAHGTAVAQLVAVAGRDTGQTILLAEGFYPADYTALRSDIKVGSRTVQIGSQLAQYGHTFNSADTAWRLEKPPAIRQSGLGPFNRPPRRLPAEPPTQPTLPDRAANATAGTVLRWTMLVGPMVMGGAMFFMFRRPMFLIFMAMGPVMAVMNWADGKRRGRKSDRVADTAFRAAVARAVRQLQAWVGSAQKSAESHYPDIPSLIRWPKTRHPRLWERRASHADFGQVAVGYAPATDHLVQDPDLDPLLAEAIANDVPAGVLPIVTDLGPGRVVGIVGSVGDCAEVAQALLLQLTVHHGPADLRLRVSARPALAGRWAWTHWLPHTHDDIGPTSVAVTPDDTEALLAATSPALLVLDNVYEPSYSAPVRSYAESGGTVLVISSSIDTLPAATDQVLQVAAPRIRLTTPATGLSVAGTGLFVPTAVCSDTARSLARLVDPEAASRQGSIPNSVNLLDVLDLAQPTPQAIINRWQNDPTRISAPIGLSEDGPISIDIVRDGPHGLLAGTTGAGKSELLRSLVASLAATVDPEHLNFVLIDYKGGSAFDACAALPHVVGVVTDLDEHLAVRAMTCLEAELEYREHVLRDAGASDLGAYLALPGLPPLPRLFLVVDEFAAMAKDLPEFMDALVDIAARGRSLGVHMLLATQRPAGVVKDTIRANTNLRIALRVQTAVDSKDVLDDGAAALLPRTIPGRGYIRFGPSELTGFQTALVTGSSNNTDTQQLELTPLGSNDSPMSSHTTRPDQRTDLDRLVEAITVAADRSGFAEPRTPWPAALPEELPLRALDLEEPATFGLVDEPQHQRQRPYTWNRKKGHIVLYGLPGTGPERAAASILASLCATHSPDELEAYVMAYGTHQFDDLEPLAHIAPVIEPDDLERQGRLIAYLGSELRERRTLQADARPDIVVVIDDLQACVKSLEPFHLTAVHDTLAEVLTKGQGLGIHIIATAFSATALRSRLATGFTQRLAFSFADRSDYSSLGLRPGQVPDLSFARAVDVATSLVVQASTDHAGIVFPAGTKRAAIATMPSSVTQLSGIASTTSYPWTIPVGIGGGDLRELAITLDAGDHLLIAGPARSGKSTTLATLARTIRATNAELQLVAVAPRRSPLRNAAAFKYTVDDPTQVVDLGAALKDADEPVVVFVDDAEMIEGLDDLIAARNPNVTVIAAIRSTEATRLFSHWTRRLRDCGQVLLLQPENGDIAGVKLPKITHAQPAGRGYLCTSGSIAAIQVTNLVQPISGA